jgi:hypothetical protein
MIKKIESFVENPYINLLIGAILFLSAISEVGDALVDDISNLNVRVHHGIMIYGIFLAIQSIPELFESMERVLRGIKKEVDEDS